MLPGIHSNVLFVAVSLAELLRGRTAGLSDITGRLCIESERPDLDRFVEGALLPKQLVKGQLNACVDALLEGDDMGVQARAFGGTSAGTELCHLSVCPESPLSGCLFRTLRYMGKASPLAPSGCALGPARAPLDR